MNRNESEIGVPKRILEMRRLITRPGTDNVIFKSDPRLFYSQGRCMAEFEDHYPEYVPLIDSQPSYSALSLKQLRWYFTWRAAIRKGRADSSGLYYIYLYLFELINNIGVTGSSEAIERMAFVINAYKNDFAGGVPMFKTWFHDYYALNSVDEPFPELVRRLDLSDLFPIDSFEDTLEYAYVLRIGGSDILDDPFIVGFGFLRFARCLNAVINNLKPLFKMYGQDIETLFEGSFRGDNEWLPYLHAIFCNQSPPCDKVFRFGTQEQYICVRGDWNRRVMRYDPVNVSVIRLIIKKTASALNPRSTGYDGETSKPRFTPYTAVVGDRYFGEIIATTAEQCLSGRYDREILPTALELETQTGPPVVKAIWKARAVSAESRSAAEIARQFVSQARILAGFTDDYDFSEPLPELTAGKCTYSMLGLPQTRMYLTWRTRYKHNKQTGANPLFAKIYANELINRIGADTDMDILEKLAALIQYAPDLSETFLDFYVTRRVDAPFSKLTRQFGIIRYFPHITIQDREFEDWYGLFADKACDKFRESAFFSEQNEAVLAGAFNYAIKKLRELFENAGLTFLILFLRMDEQRRAHWSAFSSAVCLADYSSYTANMYVNLSEYDSYSYYFAHRKWRCESASAVDDNSLYLIGYILKRLEFHLRKLKRHGSASVPPRIHQTKIKAMFSPAESYARYISLIKSDEFSNAIDSAFAEFTAPKPVKVEVDTSLLDSARKSADENFEKLMADYGEEPITQSTSQPEVITETGWGAFVSTLSSVQLRALSAVLEGKQNILAALARSEGVMAEVLIESINEAALDRAGDYIIEDTDEGPKVFEEYRNALEGMISVNG
ncbi:MAG: TerB N-terminal domain-containing protein [Clostridiales bacterium]|nr:TerB N-terminal domain-containing protein [Clostridiales bacterium]